MKRICSAERHQLGHKALSLILRSVTELRFFEDLVLEHTLPGTVQTWRLLSALQCPGQPLWRWEGGHAGAGNYWRLLESKAEQDLVLQGHSDQKVSFSDSLFNLNSKETCVVVYVSVFQLWIVSFGCFKGSGGPTSRLWLILGCWRGWVGRKFHTVDGKV